MHFTEERRLKEIQATEAKQAGSDSGGMTHCVTHCVGGGREAGDTGNAVRGDASIGGDRGGEGGQRRGGVNNLIDFYYL